MNPATPRSRRSRPQQSLDLKQEKKRARKREGKGKKQKRGETGSMENKHSIPARPASR